MQTQAAVLLLPAVTVVATGCCNASQAAVLLLPVVTVVAPAAQTQTAVLLRPAVTAVETAVVTLAAKCCNDDCCDIAKLIYTSMTACYARQRKAALDTLGRRYDCCCHPEIMNAFVYGLNDTDERVRREAADENR
ncbi:MAG: hypothetical protein R3C17_16935 [Planctomycetaceae bacterium]